MSRFRPILLTSITTVAGLTPLMLNKSFQAQFLIPMAISVAFGLLFRYRHYPDPIACLLAVDQSVAPFLGVG